MSPDAVVGWVLTVASGLRLSQAKTLADLVEAANLPGHAVQLTDLDVKRMAVEELFRDGTCGRYRLGWGRRR